MQTIPPARASRRGAKLLASVASLLSVAGSIAASLPVSASSAGASAPPSAFPTPPHYPAPQAKMESPSIPLHLQGNSLDPRFLKKSATSASPAAAAPLSLPLGASSTYAIPPATRPETATGYVEGKSIKVNEQWDATHRVWLNPDGTYTMRVFAGPQNYKDASGAWQPIDGTIQTAGDGTMHSAGLPVGLQFGATSGAADLVTVSNDHGDAVRFGAPDGASHTAKGVAAGSQVRYSGVYPGVDLEYVASSDGVKELVVLSSAVAAATRPSFNFVMRLGSLHASMRADGGVDIVDAAETAHFTIPAPIMTDSNVDPKLGDGRHGPVSFSLSMRASSTVLTVTPDASWLADPARVYPVYVDPTFQNSTQWDAYVAAAYPTSYLGDYYDTAITPNRWVVNAGRDPSGGSGVNRTYAYYALDPLVNNHTRIISGSWHGYTAWTYWAPGNTSSQFVLFPPSGYWNGGSITWNTQPSCCEQNYITQASAWQQWTTTDMTTWVAGWCNGSMGRNGLLLEGANESDSTQWRRFASVKNTDGSASYMQITYETYNTTYGFNNSDWDSGTTSNAYRGPLPSTGATLPVTVTNNGSEAWPANGNYRLAYHVYDRSGNLLVWEGSRTTMPTSVSPGQGITLNANIGGLNPGSYTLQWDMVQEGTTWFSSQGQATAGFRIYVASPPTDASPTSGGTVVAPPSLTVDPVNGATLYRFQLGTDSTFNTTLENTAWQSSNSYQVPSGDLTSGGTYYWRAMAADGAQVTSQWSATFSFVYNPHPVTVTKTLVNPPQGNVYVAGDPITFRIMVNNPGSSATAISVSDNLPAGLVATGAQVLVNSSACAGSITCAVTGQTVTVSGLSVPAASGSTPGSLIVQLTVVVTGLDRGCSTLQNIAAATASYGTVNSLPVSFVICNTGLGFENYWSYAGRTVGPGVAAQVNAANGNLVLQQTDFTPVQLHGHLALGLRRTYNSEDTTLVSVPGSIGKGWTFNVSEAGDLGDAGVGADGLSIPPVPSPLDAVLNAPPVTLVDQDGTRHTFTPNSLAAPIYAQNSSGGGGEATELQGIVNAFIIEIPIGTAAGYTNLCIDQSYTAPPGVHLSLIRFVEVAGACNAVASSPHAVLGFAIMRPDRMLSVFSWDGHLMSIHDGTGNFIRYTYANAPVAGVVLGNLMSISEPFSGRAFSFTYPSATEMDITDPAGRLAKYTFDTAVINSHLIEVTTYAKDGVTQLSDWKYLYGGCLGTFDQLCTVTDPATHTASFSYTSTYADGPAVLGPPRVASITDRLGNPTTFRSYTAPDHTLVIQGNEQTVFQSIDASGRVGEIDAGPAGGSTLLHQTLYSWDRSGATCRNDATVDNDLCSMTRTSGTSTPNEITSFTYGPNGEVLDQRQTLASGNLDTTFGYHTQNALADGSVNCVDETVGGSGVVNAGSATQCVLPNAATDTHVLYALVDKTQSLTPRGNAAGTGYAPYLTTYKYDNTASAPPSVGLGGGDDFCSTAPSAVTWNSGSLCETDAPAFDGTHATVTKYTYRGLDGERTTMTTPLGGVYTYVYYAYSPTDATQSKDLSGTIAQDGWLKAVVDPSGHFVAYAYDAAGNVQRTWDRNATSDATGHQLDYNNFPGTALAPTTSTYTETLYQPSTPAGPISSPWRYLVSQRDPLGNTTTYTVDKDGNRTAIRPPRGNQLNTPAFDITQTFDNNDQLLTRQMPAELVSGAKTINTYDVYGNLASTTDPNGNVRTFQYDAVNRQVSSKWTRGPSGGPAPLACTTSTLSDSPIPAGKVMCSTTTTYDNVDNRIQTQDGNHQNTHYTYDAVHRLISQVGPRVVGSGGTRTDTVYDQDGHVTAVCPPNLWASGATACPDGRYATTHTYDVAGRLSTTTTDREQLDNSATVAAHTTTYTYDADGNLRTTTDPNSHVVLASYSTLDRKTSETRNRDATTTLTTQWTYDPAGNTTSVTAPATSSTSRITAYAFDADNRVILTINGSDNANASAAGLTDSVGGKNIRSSVVYDADGHLVARLDPRAYAASTTSADASYMIRTDYDVDGRPVAQYVPRSSASATDPTNSTAQATQCSTAAPAPVTGAPTYPPGVGLCVTRVQYDAASNVTKVILPTSNGQDNRFIAYLYTDDQLVATIDSPDPASSNARVQTTATYDADGKPVTMTDPLGHASATAYTPDELVASTTDALSHSTSFAYDANGNKTLVTDAMGIQTATDYYADNLRKHVVGAAQDTSGTYKNTTAYAYDNVGNVTTVYSPSAWLAHTGQATDANNQLGTPSTTAYTYDNLVSYTVDPVVAKTGLALQQRRTNYGYDLGGRKLSQHTYLVDANLNAVVGGDAGTQSFAYYPDDRQSQQVGRNNETITTAYDAAGNRTSIHDSTSSGSSITATYYLDGRVRTVDDTVKTTQYAYDGSGAITARAEATSSTDGQVASTIYIYNDAGMAAAMQSTVVSGLTTQFIYDHAGRLTSESDPNTTSQTWSYNDDNTLNAHSVLAPAGQTGTYANWTYTYNADEQQTGQTFSGVTGGATTSAGLDTSQYAYGYDPAGRLSSFTNGTGASRSTKSITFDHDGNRLAYGGDAYAYNADNSIGSFTPSGGAARNFTYYPFGGLKSDSCVNSAYDGFDRLTSAAAAGVCGGGANATYTYDGLDRLRTHQDGASALVTLHYDGLSPTAAMESSLVGQVDDIYELAADGSRHAFGVSICCDVYYLADDGFGNITTVMGGVPTQVVCTARVDPFGNPVNAQGTTASSRNACNTGSTANDFFYRGGRQDTTTGNYQFGSRIYDPSKSAFLTPDSYRAGDARMNLSVGADPLTANRYSYVNGDPINLSDPDGHCSCSMSPDAQHCDPAGTDPNGNALVECGNAQSDNWHYDKDAVVPHDIHGLTADIYQTRDFLSTIGNLAKGCVSSWSGVAGCAGAVAALAGQEEIAAGLFAAAGAPDAVNCVEHPDWTDCLTAGLSLLPAGGLLGKAAIGRLLSENAGEAFAAALTDSTPTLGTAPPRLLPTGPGALLHTEATGAYAPGFEAGGSGLGRLERVQLNVSERGLSQVESHLFQFGPNPPNEAMIARLRDALAGGRSISGADAVFYTHELSESTFMARGLPYEEAHEAALAKYGVSRFSVYAPEVIQQFPEWFNQNWSDFWAERP